MQPVQLVEMAGQLPRLRSVDHQSTMQVVEAAALTTEERQGWAAAQQLQRKKVAARMGLPEETRQPVPQQTRAVVEAAALAVAAMELGGRVALAL
jgi:hypothetical protein